MAKFEAKQLLKEKKFWFASILIAWAAALQNTSSIDLKLHSDVLAVECAKFDHPVGNNQEGSSAAAAAQKSTVNGVLVNSSSNCGNSSGADRLQMTAVLRHNSGISLDWTPEEQSTLEELLSKYASDPMLVRYAKISMQLKDKTVQDVALRCRWVNVSMRLTTQNNNNNCDSTFKRVPTSGEIFEKLLTMEEIGFDNMVP